MTWKSDTAYEGDPTTASSMSMLQVGLSRCRKTGSYHQLALAYGKGEVLVAHNGGALDAILDTRPMIEDARTYDQIGKLIDKLYKATDRPMIVFHDDLTAFGDAVENKWEKAALKGQTDRDRNIEKYRGVKVDAKNYIRRFNDLSVLNIYNLTLGVDGKLMFPGQAFTNELIRMVGPIITLRRYVTADKNGAKSYRAQYDTMGLGGEFGGDRTGKLLPEEPPNLPAIIEKVWGIKPTYPITVSADGTAVRKEDK